MKSILTSFLVVLSFSLFAQFSGYYAPANWATTNTGCAPGNVNTSGAPAAVTITGAEVPNGCGSSVISYSRAVQLCGTVTFDWSYTTYDCNGAYWDPFGYAVNGVFTQLTNSNGANSQSGSTTVNVNAGDVFAFYIHALDTYCGAATSTVSNFVAPDAVCHDSNGNPKVEICHKGKTLCVAAAAVPAHLAHGDVLGTCEENDGCGGQGATEGDVSRDISPADQIRATTDLLFQSLNTMAEAQKVKANQMYPNPAKDVVNIKLDRMDGKVNITIYDIKGQLVQTNQTNIIRGLPIQLNISNLREGNYQIRFQSEGGLTVTQPLIVMKSK